MAESDTGSTQRFFDLSAMTDTEVKACMAEYQIGLTVGEARKLQETILGRAPSLAELILFGIEGSEHCSYKSSRPYLKQFTTEGPEVILGAKEDAGVVRVARDAEGNGYAIVMSHESHNHPSQLVPYEGAATGVGGNVRDVCCMGARVVALADDLRFGKIDDPRTKWLYEGVVSGIAGYGNPIGVPNLGGGLQFDPGYQDNCLVTVVTLGTVREDAIVHSYAPENADGYDLILVGKPTDNSGFGGASFASFELDDEKKEMNKGAVQEPNAFLGRHMIKASHELFKRLREIDALHRVGFKDLGAGGIACASVELADTGGYGAIIDIERIHVADRGLPPHVILCAETQERYMWVSPPDLTPLILEHYNETFALPIVSRGAAASVIGHITKEHDYIVRAGGETLGHAPAYEVTRGFLYHRELGSLPPTPIEPTLTEIGDPSAVLLRILSHENVASREPIYETYDKQVQGFTVVDAGDADSGVMRPFDDPEFPEEIRQVGITLTTDRNPRQNRIDPYQGAVNAVVEAYCNTIAAGATPIALSDCLCYGNPEKPAQMRLFAEGCRGVAESSASLEVPVIAGNVSLYNEAGTGSIPPSPMIAILGRLERADTALTPGFKQVGSDLLMLGDRKAELGGSIYYSLFGETGASIPQPDLDLVRSWGRFLTTCAAEGLLLSCHDISEGGIAAAIAEMAILSSGPERIGCHAVIPGDLSPERLFFSESFGFVLECDPRFTERVTNAAKECGIMPVRIGKTAATGTITLNGQLSVSVGQACDAWHNGLRSRL